MEKGRSDFKTLTGIPTGKIHLGRPRRRWEDNIRMNLIEIGINTRNWVDSALDRDYWRTLVNAELNLRVPRAMELITLVEVSTSDYCRNISQRLIILCTPS